MGLTPFPNGLSSFGVPVLPGSGGLFLPAPRIARGGKHLFVDGNYGADGNKGTSPDRPLLTMSKAFELLKSRDTIHVWGNIAEQLNTPSGIFDVTIIGENGVTRHPDAHTDGGGYSSARWKAPSSPTAATPLLSVRQQGWRFVNLLFTGPTDDACVELYRDTGSGDSERDASHAQFINCRFASGYNGIYDPRGCYHVGVFGCTFEALTNYCIYGEGSVGAGQLLWQIRGNHFANFTNGVRGCFIRSVIEGNFFQDGGTPNTTTVLHTANLTAGSDNFIVGNYFQTATANFNTPDIVGNATDVWAVNASIDSTSAGVGGNYEWGQPA